MSSKALSNETDRDVLDSVVGDFAGCPVPVRSDLADAHGFVLSRLRRAGTWWTGAERLAIAAESRAANICPYCAERKKALSPYTFKGEHTLAPGTAGVLPYPIIDLVHMAVTDVTRITKKAIDDLADAGLSDAHYVEALGVVVVMRSMDQTCRGLGVPLHTLPSVVDGTPTRIRPENMVEAEAYVPMVPADAFMTEDQDFTPGRGVPNVARALTLVPNAVYEWFVLSNAQYIPSAQFGHVTEGRSLSRPQIELLAGRVSALNDCFY